MKPLLCFFAFLIFASSGYAANSWQGKVIEVSNGTDLKVARSDGEIEELKLYAVKARPFDSSEGRAAQQRASSWCNQWDNVATVLPMGQDKEGRNLARIMVGGEDLANVLTKTCLAEVDVKLCRDRGSMECAFWYAWELQCRDEKKGLWANKLE